MFDSPFHALLDILSPGAMQFYVIAMFVAGRFTYALVTAKEALGLGAAKLPIKPIFVTRLGHADLGLMR